MKRIILATLTAVIMVALVCVSATIPAPKDRDVSGDALAFNNQFNVRRIVCLDPSPETAL
jgi:hypothetical protein